jgi:glutathione peroxidase
MRKLAFVALLVSCFAVARAEAACTALLDHTLPTLMDQPQALCRYQGKVLLVVNTASRCGYTPQYEGLEALYRRYRDRGLVVLGFPSNDFGGQEPGSNRDIASFCQINYGVSFPMFARTGVTSRNANPFYAQLGRQTGTFPGWNFHKYLIDRSGSRVVSFDTRVEPGDRRLVAEIERLLASK